MKTDELRTSYLEFYGSKGHTIWPSDSLVPANDPSLLFTGAGMNQFKDMFLGKGNLPFRRATTSQKCIRTGDIERVGKTASHHTFFEMLGNFSFGDYFKEEAISWAWEYVTKVLGLSKERLTVSVYKDDDEAFKIWRQKIGLPESRIYRMGAVDNFWPSNAPEDGPNGPCGPCSEIYYDRGAKYGCGKPDCKTGCSCNRYVEVWNLVFTQFERKDRNVLVPLPQKNIDTGMGLERVVSVVQDVPTNFDIDIFRTIIAAIESGLKVKSGANPETVARMRRIADHSRAVVFMIADGVLPSNEGRGYVERRLLRKAAEDAHSLGHGGTFLHALVPVIAEVMKKPYPNISERAKNIADIIKAEEDNFASILEIADLERKKSIDNMPVNVDPISYLGKETVRLHDTLGIPQEGSITCFAYFKKLSPDQESAVRIEANVQSEKLREQARAASNISKDIFDMGPLGDIKSKHSVTVFTGYDRGSDNAKVVALVKANKPVESASAGEELIVILDRTPFYGESGGQTGDTGVIKSGASVMEVTGAKKMEGFILHFARITKGIFKSGDAVVAEIDMARRLDTARHHTATHILQNALRIVLGKQVEQAGSYVAPERLRFDFTYSKSMTRDELRRVEEMVNEKIMEDADVCMAEKGIEDAKKEGALAFFGEKYGARVRVVSVGDFSKEFCGGTHLRRTGQIGLFRIVSEGSVASGTRRIEAVTGRHAVQRSFEEREALGKTAASLGVPEDRIMAKVAALQDEVKSLKTEISKNKAASTLGAAEKLADEAFEHAGEKFVGASFPDANMEDLRKFSDKFIKTKKMAGFLGVATGEGKVTVLLRFRQDVVDVGKYDAKAMMSELAKIVGGSGGGRADMAQAGGKDPSKAAEMLKAFETAVKSK